MRAFTALTVIAVFFSAVTVSILLFLFQMGYFKGII